MSIETIDAPSEAPDNEVVDYPPFMGETTTADQAQKADIFRRRYGRLLSTYAHDATLRYEPSANAETFAFYPKEMKVEVPLNWFANEKYTDDELQFANYHELSHFMDMRKNPEVFLNQFQQMKDDAKKLATEYRVLHSDEKASDDSIEHFYYQELHTLYNVLDDVYVNNIVTQRTRYFSDGAGKNAITDLYQKNGFENADLTKQPLHRQFAYSILRDEMVGDVLGESIVDERVSDVLNKKLLGQSLKSQISEEIKPKFGLLKDPADRYKFIRSIVQPKYLALLDESLKDSEQQQQEQQEQQQNNTEQQNQQDKGENQQNQSGQEQQENTDDSSQSGNSDFNPFQDTDSNISTTLIEEDKNSDEQMTDRDELDKQILDSFLEKDKVDKMSPQEREEYQNQKRQEEFDRENNISPEKRKLNEQIKQKIAKPRKEMRQFWKSLIGKSIEYRYRLLHGQRRGKINVDDYINRYSDIINSERKGILRNLDIYDRIGAERMEIDQPETIDISLLVDCSGSMGGEKTEVARETAALLMYSIKDFNEELYYTGAKLRANTEVIVFGSEYYNIKPFDRETNSPKNDANIITSISEIDSSLGGTDDDSALASVLHSITPKEQQKINSKKLKKIVFEITDGAPNDESATAATVRKLADRGILVVGFQIGDVSNYEKAIFGYVWQENLGKDKDNIHGINIGEDIQKLPKSLMDSLSNALQNIRI